MCANGLNKSVRTLTWNKLRSLRLCTGFSKSGAKYDEVILDVCWNVMKGDNVLRFSDCMHSALGRTEEQAQIRNSLGPLYDSVYCRKPVMRSWCMQCLFLLGFGSSASSIRSNCGPHRHIRLSVTHWEVCWRHLLCCSPKAHAWDLTQGPKKCWSEWSHLM